MKIKTFGNLIIKIIVSTCTIFFATSLFAEPVSFIACPVYRDADAGPKSGCWLAIERKSGITYDVGSGLTKPLDNRAILVEGVIDENSEKNAKLCGGLVLTPVRVSVLEEKCSPHILPAEGYPGRVFRPPGETMRPLTVERVLPKPPFEKTTYTILFNYSSDFLNYQYSEVILEKASLYAKASNAKVSITGYAATDVLEISGRQVQEPPELAKLRAEKVQLAFLRLGIKAENIKLEWRKQAQIVDHYAGGLAQETLRRVDIELTPSP